MIIKSSNFLHHKVSKWKEQYLFLFGVYGKVTDIFAWNGGDMEDRAITFLEFVSSVY